MQSCLVARASFSSTYSVGSNEILIRLEIALGALKTEVGLVFGLIIYHTEEMASFRAFGVFCG